MTIFQAVILSIIEGLTEFLPISSTGHLILATNFLKIPQTEFVKSFEIIIQLGAILAIITLYATSLLQNLSIWKKIITAFIPTAVLGLVFYKFIKYFLLGNTTITVISLFVGGIILIALERFYKGRANLEKIEHLSCKKSFLIGLFQSISMIPGVSRAAATILGGLFLGLRRKTSVEFSFLLAIPTMFAASVLDLHQTHLIFSRQDYLILSFGFIGSFFTAFVTAKYFLRFVQQHTFILFGFYRIFPALVFWWLIVPEGR